MAAEKEEGTPTADIVAESLLDWGVDTIFGLPGDGINGFIEALRLRKDKIRFVLVRHEESASFMACAYAKYTDKLGACVATSGPGAVHLLTGLYDAKADSTPVVAITGTTYSDMMGSHYQQDVDLLQLFFDVAVYNNMINSPEHAEMTVDIACRSAISKRGVSHLTIPLDVQDRQLSGEYSRHKVAGHTSDVLASSIILDLALINRAADILNSGERIVLLVGQGALGAGKEVEAVSQRLGAPIIKALLGKAVVPDDHPNSLGGLGMLGTEPATDAMEQADTLLMVGTSFPYIDYLPPPDRARGIQIDLQAERIGLRYPVEVGLVGDTKSTLTALLPLLKQKENPEFLRSKQQAMRGWMDLLWERSSKTDRPVRPQLVAAAVSEELEDDAIISVDSGTNTVWAARYIQLRRGMKFSLSGTLASMACGLPYAIAAQIAHPERQCVAFVGDGGFSMLMAEFATCVKYQIPVKVVVVKNNTLGMIKWEQMVFLGNPEYGCELQPIDFAAFARACGATGLSTDKPGDCGSLLDQAFATDGPVLIEAVVDPFTPPMPPKVTADQAMKFAESLVKGQPNREKIALTVLSDKVRELV